MSASTPAAAVAEGNAGGSPRARLAAGALALIAIAWIPHLGSLDNPLLRDDRTLLDNRWLLTEAGPVNVFAHDYWHGTRHQGSDLYRPLTVLGLAWNARWKMSPSTFRIVNVTLHALVAVVAGWTLLTLLRRTHPQHAATAAWVGAALFAVHPLGSEAVLFAVGRAEMLSAGFGLMALAVVAGGDPSGRAAPRVAISSLFVLAALFFKESAACWPLVLVAFRWLAPRGAVVARRASGALAGWSIALGVFLVARASVVGWLPSTPPWIDNPLVLEAPPARVANAILVHGHYLAKMVWPATLSVEHGYDQLPVVPLWPWGLAGAAALAAAWAAVAWGLGRWSPVAPLLWAFVPLAFAVTGNFAFPIGTIFAERLAYLPLFGACGLAGLAIARLPRRTAAIALLVAVLLPAAGARSARRARDLRDLRSLTEATAAASPRAVKALANLGRMRLRSGDPGGALEPLQRAVEIWPDYPRALGLLADAHATLGDAKRAAEYRGRAEEAQRRLRTATGD